jgi:hypothetical protein
MGRRDGTGDYRPLTKAGPDSGRDGDLDTHRPERLDDVGCLVVG